MSKAAQETHRITGVIVSLTTGVVAGEECLFFEIDPGDDGSGFGCFFAAGPETRLVGGEPSVGQEVVAISQEGFPFGCGSTGFQAADVIVVLP